METIQGGIDQGNRTMKILWDTTYFLPLIKISIDGIPDNLLLKFLLESQHESFYSDLSIFEITAKGLKFIRRKTEVTLQDMMNGLDEKERSKCQLLTMRHILMEN